MEQLIITAILIIIAVISYVAQAIAKWRQVQEEEARRRRRSAHGGDAAAAPAATRSADAAAPQQAARGRSRSRWRTRSASFCGRRHAAGAANDRRSPVLPSLLLRLLRAASVR